MTTTAEIREQGQSRGWDAANYANAYSCGLTHGDEPQGAEAAADEAYYVKTEQDRWQFVDGFAEGWQRFLDEELVD